MAKDIYIDTGDLSSRLLNKADDYIDTAQSKIKQVGSSPKYRGPDGYAALYTSDMMDELNSILRKLNTVESRLKKYAQLLNSGPDALAQVDKDQKNEITNWWERTCHRIGIDSLNPTIDKPAISGTLEEFFVPSTKNTGTVINVGRYDTDDCSDDGPKKKAEKYSAGGGGYSSGGGGGGAFGGGSTGSDVRREAVEKYTAGGGGYSSAGGGCGAFGSGGGGSRGVNKKDDTGNPIIDAWNDFSYGAAWLEDKYNQLDEEERKVIEEAGEDFLGKEWCYTLNTVNDIATGDVSWNTLKGGLKAIGVKSTEVNVIVETCEMVTNPTGTMKTLMDGKDMFMESATQKLADGDIGGGIADLGMSAACGLCSIGFGVGEVVTEVASSAISGVGEKVSAVTKVIGKVVPGKTGEVIRDVAEGISTVTDKVSGWFSKLLR